MNQTPPATTRSRLLALIVLCAGFLMIVLDQNIVNVALPTIQSDLGFSQADLAWVVNAYLIAFGGLLLLAGRLGDLIGRKRVFLVGLAVFTAASLWCGMATSQDMLIIARFVQGVGGAVSSAVILGMIVTLFPEPRLQAKAIGAYSFVGAGGASIGLLAGGVLTQAISWHWIFFVNLPVGIAVAALGARLLKADRGIGLGKGADVAGALLITAALMIGVYTLLKTSDYGWGSAHTIGFGATALVLLAMFIARQARAKNPLLPLRIFRSRNLSGANLVLALMLAGMVGHLFLGSLYLQRVLGYNPLEIGLAFLPVAVIIGFLSLSASPRLNTRFGERAVLVPSLVCIIAGLALLARAPADGHYLTDVLPALVLLGIGGGLAFPALVTLAMSGATPSDSGLASGVVNVTQQVGGSIGLAVLATLATSRTNDLLADQKGTAEALIGGYHLAFATASAVVAIGAVLALILLRTERATVPGSAPDDQSLPTGDGDGAVTVVNE
ncbi:DHA2 family efflux MFS transporter permease subunit [Streptosporangium sp. NBC_01639]|uniref:DHA2 family efflux MFS transporter permease subunit n=1 Tax=Streptosporangium sp. NBC_01639 TaxID=2975948 RepID=UPI00386772CD|nr:DHA2 family efflux MFS transporter permease subunit [Streptosporangium sp. NBC_01639]